LIPARQCLVEFLPPLHFSHLERGHFIAAPVGCTSALILASPSELIHPEQSSTTQVTRKSAEPLSALSAQQTHSHSKLRLFARIV
jgi:hypothetical protein